MKSKYILLTSLISAVLFSHVIIASGREETTGDPLSTKKPSVSRRVSTGMKPSPIRLTPQKTELPSWNFISERPTPKHTPVISAQ